MFQKLFFLIVRCSFMYMYFFNFCHMFWCLLDEMRNDLQTLNLLRSLIYSTQYRLYLRLWRNISRGRHSQLMSRMELKQDRLCRRVGFAQGTSLTINVQDGAEAGQTVQASWICSNLWNFSILITFGQIDISFNRKKKLYK